MKQHNNDSKGGHPQDESKMKKDAGKMHTNDKGMHAGSSDKSKHQSAPGHGHENDKKHDDGHGFKK